MNFNHDSVLVNISTILNGNSIRNEMRHATKRILNRRPKSLVSVSTDHTSVLVLSGRLVIEE